MKALSCVFCSLVLFSACATRQRAPIPLPQAIQAGRQLAPVNPHISIASFSSYEVLPLSAEGRAVNPVAAHKFRTQLIQRLDPLLGSWNAGGRELGDGETLQIHITLDELRFISGLKRFWIGPIAGQSYATAHVDLVNKTTGKKLATAQFTDISGAWAGSITVGAKDNAMIYRLADQIAAYLGESHSFTDR